MVDIYGRPRGAAAKKKDVDVDLSKYATRDEIKDLFPNLVGIDPTELVIFQDKHGKIGTSNIRYTDIIRRVIGANPDNFPMLTNIGQIKDSGVSISTIRDEITRKVATAVARTGDTMTGELNMNNNKITALRDPTGNDDAATKKYVDATTTTTTDKLSAVESSAKTTDDKLTVLQTDYNGHVSQFRKLRADFFGKGPIKVEINLADIKKALDDNKRILDDVTSVVPEVGRRVSLIKIPTGTDPDHISNLVYTVKTGTGTWTSHDNTIKYTSPITGAYRLSLFSAQQFSNISVRHSLMWVPRSQYTITVIIKKDVEETFTLTPTGVPPAAAPYRYCIEFIADFSDELPLADEPPIEN